MVEAALDKSKLWDAPKHMKVAERRKRRRIVGRKDCPGHKIKSLMTVIERWRATYDLGKRKLEIWSFLFTR